MPYASNNGVRLFWDQRGEGTPVVLVMGHRYSSAMWYPIIDALVEDGHQVVWYDNRGTGKTDTTGDVTIADFVADTLTVMDAAGIDRAHIFGVSMGGGIVLDLAIRHPERCLSVVLGCTCMKTPDMPSTPAWVRLFYYAPQWMLKLLLGRPKVANNGYGSAADPAAVKRDMAIAKDDPYVTRGLVAQAKAIADYSVRPEVVAAVAVPALVMHGDEDGTVPYALGVKLAETLPHSELVTLEGAGHNYLVASPVKTKATLLDFLRRMDVRAGAAA